MSVATDSDTNGDRPGGPAPPDDSPSPPEPEARQREVLVAEAEAIEARHQGWADAQNLQAAWWRRWDTTIKASASVLAAASGGAGLASETYRTVAGIAALAAAVLTGMGSAFGSSQRSSEYFAASATNQTVADQARDFRTTVAAFSPLEEAYRKFAELCEKRDAAVSNAPLRLGVRASGRWRQNPARIRPAGPLGNQAPR